MLANATETPAASETIEFIKKGQVTIPKKLRDHDNITPDQKGTLIELSGGFLILPKPSHVPGQFDEIRQGIETQEMSQEEMISEMRKIREETDSSSPSLIVYSNSSVLLSCFPP